MQDTRPLLSVARYIVLGLLLRGTVVAGEPMPAHGAAMHGDLKYPPQFTHFDYVNPDAPKGGEVRMASIGTFDNLNPFILKGIAADGIGDLFDTLMASADDEPFSQYGLIAESIEMPEDRSWVAYTLRPEARFQDGTPITPADVIFSLEILRSKGHPFYRSYYGAVSSAEQVGERKVRFSFNGGKNRELPLILGQLPVLSKAYWAGRDFAKTTLEPPLGSGPYRVDSLDPGRSISYRRDENYWARDLPVNKGRYNFGSLRVDYYRDTTVALEAFKAGEYDFRQENIAKNWATAYNVPPVRQGRIKLAEIPHQSPTGMQAFVFNTRREMFRDPRVRQALGYAFDFEWANKNLFYGAYARTNSFFSNSELASRGLPGAEELAVLEPYRDRLPAQVFNQEYQPPGSDGSGNIRDNLRQAMRLLKEAGWEIRDRKLVHAKTAQPLSFEILLVNPAFERVVLPYTRNLKRLGIEARVRTVDSTQYQNRLNEFDFDMIVHSFGQSLSPGNEQGDFWGSAQADLPGSRNLAGVSDPVIDGLIEAVIAAPDRASLVARTRALDRALLWGHYVIPHWHLRYFRVAYWEKFGRPAVTPKYALGMDGWWVDTDKQGALDAHRRGTTQ